MPVATATQTPIGPFDMTGDQLAEPGSERVSVQTKLGEVVGGRTRNGAQVFLNVPYGVDVPRWADPEPLPADYDYTGKEYTKDALYCAQPSRFYTQHIPMRNRLGLGSPTENPFFADIYTPSHVNPDQRLPVRVFIHGGFMQFGSTSGQFYNQQFFSAEHFGEIRVLLGHRISVLGLLGSSKPEISGNYSFKDCWLGLQWVQEHIASFGGDPDQVHLSGLSGGGHIVGQLVHYAARQAPAKAPFVTALLQSNAVLTNPVHPSERNFHVQELCERLGIDYDSPDVLEQLRDTKRVSTEALIAAVQGDGEATTYRGVEGTDGWVAKDMMEYQESGGLARDLRAAGVKCIIAGDVKDEAFFYKNVHPCQSKADIRPHLQRFYPDDITDRLIEAYPIADDASAAECDKLLGQMFADGQVHLPVRLMLRDLSTHGFPTVKYAIEMVAAKLESKGIVTHGSDLIIQHYRLSMLSPEEAESVLKWHKALDDAVSPALVGDGSGFKQRPEEEMLLLTDTGKTYWAEDWRLPGLRAAEKALRG